MVSIFRQSVILSLYMLCLVFPSKAIEERTFIIDFSNPIAEQLNDFPDEIYLSHWTVESDINCSLQQLDYLIGLPQEDYITHKMLFTALFYLQKSEKYKRVEIVSHIDKKGHWTLNFLLRGQWTLDRISVDGIWFGKDNYKHLYGLESGGIFNWEKHEAALEHIKEHLINNGYLNAQVSSCITEQESTKTVNVVLSIYKGKRFTINGVSVCSSKNDPSQDQQFLLRQLLKNSSKQLLRSTCKQALIQEEISAIQHFLYHHGYPYASILLDKKIDEERHTILLTFTIDWKKELKSVVRGNKFFNDKQLKEHMMRGSDHLWSISVPVCIRELKELYRSKGFAHIKVSCNQAPHEWEFLIDEGERIFIDDIEFEGNDHFSDQRLRKHFNFLLKKPYDESHLQNSVDTLVEEYLENGFWDVNVYNKELIVTEGQRGVVKFSLQEGRRRYLAHVSIPGFDHLIKKGPFVRFKTVELPIPFKMSYLKEQRKWLLSHFKRHGYYSIHLKPELNEKDDGIYLSWDVQLHGPRTTFGKTIIKGSPGINVDHIYRELCYDCGTPRNKKKLEKTFVRLKNLNIYETVSVFPLADLDPCGNQPIVVKVVSDDPFEIRTRIGFQQVSKNLIFREKATYKVGGSFIYKNVTGNEDQIRMDGDFTRFYRVMDISYSLPWTFGVPVKTVVKGYCNKFDQPVYIGSKKTLYRARHNGGLIGGQYKQSSFNAALNIGGETTKIDKVSTRLARAIDFQPALINKWVPYASVEPNLFIESLNDKLYPTKGFMTLFSCKWMVPLAHKAEYFSKVLIEQAIFFPISRAVFAMRVRAGHIYSRNFSEVIPPERFYLGGPNSIRCYLPDLAPPLGRITLDSGEKCCFPQGGSTMVNMNFELRIPFFSSMSVVVFNDLGILSKPINEDIDSRSYQVCCPQNDDIDPELWHQHMLGAVGVGLNYNTPIGPLRFDIGWNINRNKADDASYAWYLTLGHSF